MRLPDIVLELAHKEAAALYVRAVVDSEDRNWWRSDHPLIQAAVRAKHKLSLAMQELNSLPFAEEIND